MAVVILRKTVRALSVVLKWILWAASASVKLAFWMAGLLLMLFLLAVSGVSEVTGVTSGRR